jgi:hypothetical protein
MGSGGQITDLASDAEATRKPSKKIDDFEGTIGIVEQAKPNEPLRVLSDARTGRHERYDRVVFEFSGAVPGYRVQYIDKPVRKCGSGDPTQIEGDGWLEVTFNPANAHTEEGKPTVTQRERHERLGVLRELELTCDFEAYVTWVMGVASPNRYRVLELSDPPRLVIDIHH